MIVIGFAGAAGAGKTTAAQTLKVPVLSFADPLRQMALILNPVITDWGMRLKDAVELYGWTRSKQECPEVRKYLQTLGTEAVRDILGEYVWVEAMYSRLASLQSQGVPCVAIDDVRMANEADLIYDFDGYLVRITGRGYTGTPEHRSEQGDFPVDYEVDNSGEISDMESALRDTLEGII